MMVHKDCEGTGMSLIQQLVSPKKRRLGGNVINVYKCFTGGGKKRETKLFLAMTCDNSRGDVNQLKHKKFHWITENNFSV